MLSHVLYHCATAAGLQYELIIFQVEIYLDSEEDDGAETHPRVEGVQVPNGLVLAVLVLVLKKS